jgi:hypothetical protein
MRGKIFEVYYEGSTRSGCVVVHAKSINDAASTFDRKFPNHSVVYIDEVDQQGNSVIGETK